jgi:hypothetical protein
VKGVYNTCVRSDAQVFQFDTNTGNTSMLVYITNDGDGDWENLVWVNLANKSLGASIYENDIVYLVGRLDGTYNYDTSTGGNNTVPQIDVTQLRLAPATSPKKPVTPPKTGPVPGGHVVGAFPATAGASSNGGYILYSNGEINAVGGAPFYGDARHSGLTNFVAVAQDGDNAGYWLVTATGKVFTFGQVCQGGDTVSEPAITGPIVGTMYLSITQEGQVDTGFQMVNSAGTVYTYACNYGA